jgi:hypothetical protein
VTSTLLARKLWQAASIDVFVDGQCHLRTGGVFKLVGEHSADFDHKGNRHKLVVTWGHAKLRSFPIKLEIDGLTLHDGPVTTGNWPLSLWPWLAMGGLASHLVLK